MDNTSALRSRYRAIVPPPSRIRYPPQQSNHYSFRQVFGILKLVLLLVIISLAILSSQLPQEKSIATSVPSRSALARVLRLPIRSSQPRKMPLVDRSILQRLAEIETETDPDERPYFSPEKSLRRMPLVTHIPELSHKKEIPPTRFDCGRLPCRFLLPLRISEQESNSRLHLPQLFRIAKELNRTLVLPNVAKARIGVCFKWAFETYFGIDNYHQTFISGRPSFVKLEVFQHWIQSQDNNMLTGRSVVLSSKPLENTPTNADSVQIRIDNNPQLDLPKCFSSKFETIHVHDFPSLLIHPLITEDSGPAIIEALSSPESVHEDDDDGQPAVLLLTYDLRYPIFNSLAPPQYSSTLQTLATRLSPISPYIAVHWRTESMVSDLLPRCAEELVNLLMQLLGEYPTLKSVWFAHDAESNWDGFQLEALALFRGAFAEGERLSAMELEEFNETGLANAGGIGLELGLESGMFHDTGVHGILDKLIASKATVFVAGGMGCARKSSITQQIIDMRRETGRVNIVEYFGL